MRIALLIPVLALALSFSPAGAASSPAPGDSVRVTLIARPDAPITGHLLDLEPAALTLAADSSSAERTCPRESIKQLEVHRIGNHAASGAVIGALIFAVPGVILGILAGGADDSPDLTEGEGAVRGGLICGAIGAGVGYLIGRGTPHEYWEKVAP